jgi:hypothetical protein
MIEGVPVADIGPWALVSLIVLLVLTDKLVPGRRIRALEQQLATKDETIAKKDQTISELAHQNRVMLDSAIPTVNNVLSALHQAAEIEDRRR